jgi:hypothetical protein
MTIVRLILNMCRRYGYTALLLLRSFVYLIERYKIRHPLQAHVLCYRSRQGRLAVIYMPDRAHIYMRLGPLKLLLRHLRNPPMSFGIDFF